MKLLSLAVPMARRTMAPSPSSPSLARDEVRIVRGVGMLLTDLDLAELLKHLRKSLVVFGWRVGHVVVFSISDVSVNLNIALGNGRATSANGSDTVMKSAEI